MQDQVDDALGKLFVDRGAEGVTTRAGIEMVHLTERHVDPREPAKPAVPDRVLGGPRPGVQRQVDLQLSQSADPPIP